MQSRDLVEAHRLVFSAKLYDHQGPIARGGGRTNPPPPDRPRYEKCPDRARVKFICQSLRLVASYTLVFFREALAQSGAKRQGGRTPSPPLVPWKYAKWHVPARVKVLLLASEIVSEGLSAGTASAALSA